MRLRADPYISQITDDGGAPRKYNLIKPLRDLLTSSIQVVGHNVKADITHVSKDFDIKFGFEVVHDTMNMLERCLGRHYRTTRVQGSEAEMQ